MRLNVFVFSALMLWTGGLHAAHTRARLLLSADTARPGDTIMAGLHLRMDRGWHTYWRNAGDSGLATSIAWELPEGIAAQPIRWPVPEKLSDEGLTTYVYNNEVVLLVPLKLSPNMKAGPYELKAKASWLECEIKCVPGDADVKATLTVGPDAKQSKDAQTILAWRTKLPKVVAGLDCRAWWEDQSAGDSRTAVLDWNATDKPEEVDFYPYGSEQFEIAATTEKLGDNGLRLRVNKLQAWPERIAGLLILTKGAQTAYEIDVPVTPEKPAATR